jgi:hypothetical protein
MINTIYHGQNLAPSYVYDLILPITSLIYPLLLLIPLYVMPFCPRILFLWHNKTSFHSVFCSSIIPCRGLLWPLSLTYCPKSQTFLCPYMALFFFMVTLTVVIPITHLCTVLIAHQNVSFMCLGTISPLSSVVTEHREHPTRVFWMNWQVYLFVWLFDFCPFASPDCDLHRRGRMSVIPTSSWHFRPSDWDMVCF